jgi:hypothetical protein
MRYLPKYARLPKSQWDFLRGLFNGQTVAQAYQASGGTSQTAYEAHAALQERLWLLSFSVGLSWKEQRILQHCIPGPRNRVAWNVNGISEFVNAATRFIDAEVEIRLGNIHLRPRDQKFLNVIASGKSEKYAAWTIRKRGREGGIQNLIAYLCWVHRELLKEQGCSPSTLPKAKTKDALLSMNEKLNLLESSRGPHERTK